MSITIRQTTDSDWLDLKTLRMQSLMESPTAFGLSYEAVSKYTDQQWQERAGNRTPPMYFIARQNGASIGLIGAVKANNQFNLIAMWVVPEHRGSGVGKALVEKVLSIAASRGESEVSLFVSPLNQAACGLYEKAGFRFTEQVEPLESHPEILVQRMSVDISSTHRQA